MGWMGLGFPQNRTKMGRFCLKTEMWDGIGCGLGLVFLGIGRESDKNGPVLSDSGDAGRLMYVERISNRFDTRNRLLGERGRR